MAMGGVEYRLYIGDRVASTQVYDAIDTVTVDLGIDLASEAQIEIMTYTGDHGTWHGVDQPFATAWQRIRLEVRNGTAKWVPLIDGPVVQRTLEASGEPGASTLTIVARDDSVYLNRSDNTRVYEGQTDDDIARQLFSISPLDQSEPDIDSFPPRPSDRPLQFVSLGTRMESLRKLGEPYNFHAYVVPGATPNTSQGCLKEIDWGQQVTLPTVVLVGPERNIETFYVTDAVGEPSVYVAGSLTLDDLTVDRQTSTWTDVDLVGGSQQVTPAAALAELGRTLISPWLSAFHDAKSIATAQQQRASLTVTATGVIRGGCYCGILTPYDLLNVSGVDQSYCTTYVIKEVTHTFTRSEYRQDFTIYTNAYAKPASWTTTAATNAPPPDVF